MRRKRFLSSIAVFTMLNVVFVISVYADSDMWIQVYGGTGTEEAWSVVETPDGGYAIAGYTKTYGVGEPNEWGIMPANMWLVKTDELGNAEWNQTYGGAHAEIGRSLIVTSDGGFAIAGDRLLVKTDEYGNMEWNQTVEGITIYSLVEVSTGGYAIAGHITTGIENADFLLVKTDETGSIVWTQTYGGEYIDHAWSMIATSDGGYAIAGNTGRDATKDCLLIKTDEYGNMEWNQTYGGAHEENGRSLVEASDGGYVIAGSTKTYGAGKEGLLGKRENLWLIKTDAYGNMEWNQTYGGGDMDYAMSLIKTSDGGYAIAGQTFSFGVGSGDFWLIKTDAYGNMEWNQTYGGGDMDYPLSLIESSEGGYAMAGITYSFGVGSGDFLLIKTDELGVIPESTSCLLPALLLVATFVVIVYTKRNYSTRK